MEQASSSDAGTDMTAEQIINGSLVIANLKQRSLKEVLADYSDRQQLTKTNTLERAAQAVGLKDDIRVEKTVRNHVKIT